MQAKRTPEEVKAEIVKALLAQRFRVSKFEQFISQLAEIYRGIDEPPVTSSPSRRSDDSQSLVPTPADRQRMQESRLLAAPAAIVEARRNAIRKAIEITDSWQKAGVPSQDIWDILNEFDPEKKRFIKELAPDHAAIKGTIERQMNACQQIVRLIKSGIHALPSALCIDMVKANAAIETYTKTLTTLKKAGQVINEAAKHYVHPRSRSRTHAQSALMLLREKHVQETRSERSRRTVQLLNAWISDPDNEFKAASTRSNYGYKRP